MNGGRECPPLIENRGCFRTQCGGRELGKHLVHSCKSHIFYIRKIFSKELSLIEIALIHVSGFSKLNQKRCANFWNDCQFAGQYLYQIRNRIALIPCQSYIWKKEKLKLKIWVIEIFNLMWAVEKTYPGCPRSSRSPAARSFRASRACRFRVLTLSPPTRKKPLAPRVEKTKSCIEKKRFPISL